MAILFSNLRCPIIKQLICYNRSEEQIPVKPLDGHYDSGCFQGTAKGAEEQGRL